MSRSLVSTMRIRRAQVELGLPRKPRARHDVLMRMRLVTNTTVGVPTPHPVGIAEIAGQQFALWQIEQTPLTYRCIY